MSDRFFDYLGLITVGLFLTGLSYGSFWLGKWHERRAYKADFVCQIEQAYMDGWKDGNKQPCLR